MFETLDELLKWQPPLQQEIISNGILPAGGKLILAGKEETFKTMLSTYAGFCISLGLPFLGFQTTKVRVGVFQAELTKAMFRERVFQLVKCHNADLSKADIYFATSFDIKLNKPIGISQIATAVKNLGLGLLIIDPVYKVLAADISDWLEMSKLTDGLDLIARSYNCAIWLVHHRRKYMLGAGGVIDLGSDELIGSSALKDWADTICRLERQQDILTMDFTKVRNARVALEPIRIKFNRHDLSFSVL